MTAAHLEDAVPLEPVDRTAESLLSFPITELLSLIIAAGHRLFAGTTPSFALETAEGWLVRVAWLSHAQCRRALCLISSAKLPWFRSSPLLLSLHSRALKYLVFSLQGNTYCGQITSQATFTFFSVFEQQTRLSSVSLPQCGIFCSSPITPGLCFQSSLNFHLLFKITNAGST